VECEERTIKLFSDLNVPSGVEGPIDMAMTYQFGQINEDYGQLIAERKLGKDSSTHAVAAMLQSVSESDFLTFDKLIIGNVEKSSGDSKGWRQLFEIMRSSEELTDGRPIQFKEKWRIGPTEIVVLGIPSETPTGKAMKADLYPTTKTPEGWRIAMHHIYYHFQTISQRVDYEMKHSANDGLADPAKYSHHVKIHSAFGGGQDSVPCTLHFNGGPVREGGRVFAGKDGYEFQSEGPLLDAPFEDTLTRIRETLHLMAKAYWTIGRSPEDEKAFLERLTESCREHWENFSGDDITSTIRPDVAQNLKLDYVIDAGPIVYILASSDEEQRLIMALIRDGGLLEIGSGGARMQDMSIFDIPEFKFYLDEQMKP